MKTREMIGIAPFILMVLLSFILTACSGPISEEKQEKLPTTNHIIHQKAEQQEANHQEADLLEVPKETSLPYMMLNQEGDTIQTRYNPPKGFTRIEAEETSFGAFLRNQKLKPYGEKALYYDGRSKRSEGVYDSVLDVEIGNRDLHQCADAIMLLRAEYLYSHERYEEIQFHFVNGFLADYKNWVDGYRIQVDGNNVNWIPGGAQGTGYESFRKYMDMVFAYAGTLSLDQELISKEIEDIDIGDVFIQGGSPGHAVIVVDMAKNNETGEKVFILAQSYMPAQQTQVLINPNDEIISPWYSLEMENQLVTPEWKFNPTDLKSFE